MPFCELEEFARSEQTARGGQAYRNVLESDTLESELYTVIEVRPCCT